MTKLPVLDISELLADADNSNAKKIGVELRNICHSQGFCYLVGHGLETKNEKIARVAGQFFKLPFEERAALAISNSPHFRGYTFLGDERTKGQADWRIKLILLMRELRQIYRLMTQSG